MTEPPHETARRARAFAGTPKNAKDRPWVMRTYAGHSTAAASNALYRTNLAKGQTGLSVAFDLPTQTGYDPDDALSRGEVGKVGVPIPHLGEMRRLFADIPLTEMNTSMTINATAMWLLALYQVVAEEQNPGLDPRGRRPPARRHDPERHRQGVPLARHLRVPAGALAAPDHRRDRLHRPRDPDLEPDQHLQLPPAGGRGDADPGDRLRAVHGDRRARRGPGLGSGLGGRLRQGRRPDLVLRQRRRPVHRGDLQDAGLRAAVGPSSPASGTASRTRRCGASATASRSTASVSPRLSRRTTSSGSCSRCSA